MTQSGVVTKILQNGKAEVSDIIDAILTTDYILVQYPIKLVCTMLMESVTLTK